VVAANNFAALGIAQVACNQLGYEDNLPAAVEDPAAFGAPKSDSWLNMSACAGSEGMLLECSCVYPHASNTTNSTELITEKCTSGVVKPVLGSLNEEAAGQVAITCVPSSGRHNLYVQYE